MPASPSLRVLVFGMACAASAPPLAAVLRAGLGVEALVLADESPPACPLATGVGAGAREQPDDQSGLPSRAVEGGRVSVPVGAAESEPERLAVAAGVPVLRAEPGSPAVLDLASDVDAIVVACFPRKLPPALLARPRLGGLNVHPSLLPLGRGPEPVFWTLRRGERRTGPTVHRLDAGFDTGPVVAQRAIDMPAGVRALDLERDLMALGGELLVEALPRLAAGNLAGMPQDDDRATSAPTPTPADWLVPTTLPAAWAFSFARGVAPLNEPLAVRGPFGVVPVRDAVAHHPTERPPAPVQTVSEGIRRVRFSPGWVEFDPG